MSRHRAVAVLWFVVLVVALSTCSEPPTAPPTPVTSVSLLGPGLMYLGRSSQFQALAHDHAGNLITGHAVTWASDSPSVASIDTAGLVASHAVGVATVSATIDGVKGAAILAVILPPISQVIVTPPRDSAFVGDSIQLSVVVRDVDGPIETGRTILWSVSDTAKASVTARAVPPRHDHRPPISLGAGVPGPGKHVGRRAGRPRRCVD